MFSKNKGKSLYFNGYSMGMLGESVSYPNIVPYNHFLLSVGDIVSFVIERNGVEVADVGTVVKYDSNDWRYQYGLFPHGSFMDTNVHIYGVNIIVPWDDITEEVLKMVGGQLGGESLEIGELDIEQREQIVKDITNTIPDKDLLAFSEVVKDPDKFNKLLKLVKK